MRNLGFVLVCLFLVNITISAQDQLILKSGYIAKPDTIWAFMPADYKNDINSNYPLIYLLHGWSGNYKQWNDIMDCQSYADKYSCIIVCPDGLHDSWYINSPAIKESQFTDFFFNDLMPEILNKYRIDKNNIFITGLSMGGHGALYLFAQKPELFSSAGSISGVVDLSFCPDKYSIDNNLGLSKQNMDKEILNKYSVIGNIEKIAASDKEIIFSCGTEDPFYEINNAFRKKCDELKIKAVYISEPGGHDYNYWKTAIKYQFQFFVEKSNN